MSDSIIFILIKISGGHTIEPVIVAENLKKHFNGFVAVDDVSFTVNSGEVFGFLGPNGAGKTTTMRMIQCVSPLDGGKLEVFGLDVSKKHREIKSFMGVVPQENNLDPDFSVYKNLYVFSRYFDIPKAEAEKRIGELLEFVQLNEKKDTVTDALSGGMKRRLILARALINNPKLLMLDEPTVGLDPQSRHIMWDKLRELKKNGATIVMTTHYLEEAAQLCDRLVVMDNGKILVEGTPEDIIQENIGSDIVETEDSEEIRTCLENNKARYEVIGDIIQIYTSHPQMITDRLMNECTLVKITARKATLEDVFLKLTGRKLRE
ncbi:lipooligosaccharide transport system ATP-binding protein [Methanohalophilus levihalophilus]|uniref:ABC transporter ATP-binding protein n=1 Tax=Methanohalophilus levihalophilus TaxID=1431282 RepID=UPI001FD9203B|nr:ATP-binding cassette domain-containing protein [Methanohalophilus levihalophilus]MBP2029899.1 lipooligosaccharide transport system ATP-binding protein [Methanohalophilus levihalophilus]